MRVFLIVFIGVASIASAQSADGLQPLCPIQTVMLPLSFPEEDIPITAAKTGTAENDTIRGQGSSSMSELDEILNTPPPHAAGTIGTAVIEPKLTEDTLPITGLDENVPTAAFTKKDETTLHPLPVNAMIQNGQFAYGTLLIAVIAATLGLIYTAFVAYDYRQRWVQSLTSQSERYNISGLDNGLDEMYI